MIEADHFEVCVEDAEGIECTTFATYNLALAAYAKEVGKLKRGERATLNKVTPMEAAEGD